MRINAMNNAESVPGPLWTRDFTILTLGSVVSMLGSTLSSFAMDLMVLDATGSTGLFALYGILFFLPNALAPVLAGPLLDRFSRKKTIYTLDFITAGLFAALTLLLLTGQSPFPVLAAANFLLGGIAGVYTVAYDSFFPLLVTEGNFQKAYSVSSTLETLSVVMVPVSAFIYKTFGIVPLFLANTVTYLAAAVMETRIRAQEHYSDKLEAASPGLRRFWADFRQGLDYLRGEKGLLAIAVYFLFSNLTGGMTGVVTLPCFRGAFPDGEYIYMLVWGSSSLARFLGGLIHYRWKLPAECRFRVALLVYITLSLLEGTYLFVPVPGMMAMMFCFGLLGVTSYNIRLSSTQKYVPDEKKGRFNGVFGTLSTVGILLGQALAGALAGTLGERSMVVLANALCLAAAVIFIGGGKKHVEKIYNTQA